MVCENVWAVWVDRGVGRARGGGKICDWRMWLGFSAVAGLQRLSHSDSHPSRDCSPRQDTPIAVAMPGISRL